MWKVNRIAGEMFLVANVTPIATTIRSVSRPAWDQHNDDDTMVTHMDTVTITDMDIVTISIIIIGKNSALHYHQASSLNLISHPHRHRRTPSSSSLASNTLRRGTHSSNGGGSGNCCDYLKVTVSDHQSPKIYVEKCCAGGPGPGAPSDNLDDEVERYFYVHQGTNHSSRKSSLAHGGAGTGSASQYGSHCSLNRSRCGSIRRRRSDHSITTTADVMTSGASGSRSTTPLIHRNSNERLRHMATRTMSPMMLEFHNSYQGASGCGTGGRARASSSGSAGSCHARDDGHYSSNELIPIR